MQRTRKWNLSLREVSLFTVLMLSTFLTSTFSHAATEGGSDDDYNFSWLDPEKKIYVLQNRKFRKADSVHLYLMGGTAIGETYRSVYDVQPRMGMWFNEEFGLEAFYSGRFHSPNNNYKALDAAIASGGLTKSPLIREIKSQFGVLLNWAPWYAKINVFNTILYFDWYFSLGLGTMSTEIGEKTKDTALSTWKPENLFAVYLGTGHLFHLSEKWITRLDFLGHFYSAPIYGGQVGLPADKAIFSNFTFNIGIGLKL